MAEGRSTCDDGLLLELRRHGRLGPFHVADVGSATDIGLVRSDNQDRWSVVDDRLIIVADGMGGAAGGARAADLAVAEAAARGVGMTDASAADLAEHVNRTVRERLVSAGFERAGTTLVVLSVHTNHVALLSVGDSRAYRWRGGELEQLTHDHTVREELAAAGLSVEQAHASGLDLDALTSHIGRRSVLGLPSHRATYSVVDGDRFLLCTDGVHGQVPFEEMRTLLARRSCRDAALGLVEAARHHGGLDNATAVVVQLSSEDRRRG